MSEAPQGGAVAHRGGAGRREGASRPTRHAAHVEPAARRGARGAAVDASPARLALRDVHVRGRRAPLLHLDALSLATGECVLVAGEPGQGHTALALVATGRLAPFTGVVELTRADGTTTSDPAVLRGLSAVVDLPGVTEPDDTLTTSTVVGEELALAGAAARPSRVRRWLEAHELTPYRDVRMDDLPGPVRTALLTSLAIERRGVRFLVVSLPDRHGGEPAAWWAVAQACAARGYGVLVQCSRSSARELGAELAPARGTTGRATPVESLRTGTDRLVAAPDEPAAGERRSRTDTGADTDTDTDTLSVDRDERPAPGGTP